MCNCDLQRMYQPFYTDTGSQVGQYQQQGRLQSALEPSPYQYVEELRASPYQQAMAQASLATGAVAASKRSTRSVCGLYSMRRQERIYASRSRDFQCLQI